MRLWSAHCRALLSPPTTLSPVRLAHQPEDPQPGGRSPAPGDLGLVQAFLNTRWDLRTDHAEAFVSGDALAYWLSARGLLSPERRLSAGDVQRAVAVREGLRAVAFFNNGHSLDESAVDAMHRQSQGARVGVRIAADGPEFLLDAEAGLEGALGVLYA